MGAPARIGILGGMGPEATVLLQSRLIAAVPAQDDADHIPLIIDMNPQVPSRIAHLIDGTGPDPTPILTEMAQGLHRAGAQALAMPCNTAHSYADAIGAAVPIPFLDMIGATVAQVAALSPRPGTVGILASPALRRTGVLDRGLAGIGIDTLWPRDDVPVLGAIRRIKAEGATAEARAAIRAASDDLLARGASVQIIGCSEFSLAADAIAPGAYGIDTLDCLVQAICDFALARTGEPGT